MKEVVVVDQVQLEIENEKKSTEVKAEIETKHSLKGTFISVMLIGSFIVVLWVSIFLLFLSRG